MADGNNDTVGKKHRLRTRTIAIVVLGAFLGVMALSGAGLGEILFGVELFQWPRSVFTDLV